MKDIVLITSNEVRHKFFRRILANSKDINLKLCIVEDTTHKQSREIFKNTKASNRMKEYFHYRDAVENDFFSDFTDYVNGPKVIIKCKRGEFNNNRKILKKIETSKPDLIVSYGCALVKNYLIQKYGERFINVHLGLSPYYKGVGSNFWAYLENKPELIGSTIMMIDPGIDSGKIIHQIKPKIYFRDNFHIISARLIRDTAVSMIKILKKFNKLKKYNQRQFKKKTFYKKDFNDNAILRFDRINHQKIFKNYLNNKKNRDKKLKLIKAF